MNMLSLSRKREQSLHRSLSCAPRGPYTLINSVTRARWHEKVSKEEKAMSSDKFSHTMNHLLRTFDFGPSLSNVGKKIHNDRNVLEKLILDVTGSMSPDRTASHVDQIIRSIDAASKLQLIRSIGRRTIQRRLESIEKTAAKMSELLREAHQMNWIRKEYWPDYTPGPEKLDFIRRFKHGEFLFPSGAPVPKVRLLDESLLCNLNPIWATSVLTDGIARSAERQLEKFDKDFAKFPSKTRLDLEVIACSIYLLWEHSSPTRKKSKKIPVGENSPAVRLFEHMCYLADIENTGDPKYHLQEAADNRGACGWTDP